MNLVPAKEHYYPRMYTCSGCGEALAVDDDGRPLEHTVPGCVRFLRDKVESLEKAMRPENEE